MRLHRLVPLVQRHGPFQELVSTLDTSQRSVLSAITPARPLGLAAFHTSIQRPLLLVVARPGEARAFASELRAWCADPEAVLLFPETDALPYDRLPNEPDKLAERLGVLQRLSGLARDSTP